MRESTGVPHTESCLNACKMARCSFVQGLQRLSKSKIHLGRDTELGRKGYLVLEVEFGGKHMGEN